MTETTDAPAPSEPLTTPAPESAPPPAAPAAPVEPAAPAKPLTLADAIAGAQAKLTAEPKHPSLAQAPEGAPDAPPLDGAPPPEGEAPAPEPIRLTLPPRRPEDAAVLELELPADTDPEVVERFKHLQNGFLRGEQVREYETQVMERETRLQESVDSIVVDPVGFLGEQLGPADRARLTLHLLATDPRVWQETFPVGDSEPATIEEHLQRLLDPDSRATLRSELKAERVELRDARKAQLDERRDLRQRARVVSGVIEALVPPSLQDDQTALFLRDAKHDLLVAAQQSEDGLIHPNDVPRILWPRLKAHGMSEAQVQTVLDRLRQEQGTQGRHWRNGQYRPGAGGPPDAATPPAPTRVTAKPTIQDLQAADQRRRGVALAPPGAGARAPAPGPDVRGMTIDQAIQAMRARRATPA